MKYETETLELVNDVVAVCKTMKADLRKRTGKTWSVTRGRGTVSGWITITAPESRLQFGSMTKEDQAELSAALGIEHAHHQGVSIPASHAHYREYLDRCSGKKPSVIGVAYWD
jgi:hypothetical protein